MGHRSDSGGHCRQAFCGIQIGQDLIGVLAQLRGAAQFHQRSLGELRKCARVANCRRIERTSAAVRHDIAVIDVLPVLTESELLGIDHLAGVPHRRDEHPPGHRRVQQLGLGLGGEEIGEDPLDPLVLRDWLATVEQHHGVLGPVFVPRGLVAEALLVHPGHEVLGECSETRSEQERHRGVPVGTRPHELYVDALQAGAAGDALSHGRIHRRVECGRHGGLAHGPLGGRVDVLAQPRAGLAVPHGDQCRSGSLGCRVVERLRKRAAGAKRCPVRVAGDRHVHR